MIERCTKIHLQKPARWQKCNCIELAEAKHGQGKNKTFSLAGRLVLLQAYDEKVVGLQ